MALLAQVADTSAQDSLCRVQILFLYLKDFRATADWIDKDTRDEGDGDACVVATYGEVNEVPALCPCAEA